MLYLYALLSLLVSAVAETTWYAVYDLPEADTLELTKQGCYRGNYGGGEFSNRTLSLLTCGEPTAKLSPFATLPDEAFLCVLELVQESSVPASKQMIAELGLPVHEVVLFSGQKELVLINHEGGDKIADLPEYCCESHFPGHALNARYVATQPIRPQREMPKDHRAIQRAFGRQSDEKLEPDPVIQSLLSQFSQQNIIDYVQFLSTKEGTTTSITRNSYSMRIGAGGCASADWRCAGNPQDFTWSPERSTFQWVRSEVEGMFANYPWEWNIDYYPFRNDMCPNIILRIPAAQPNSKPGVIVIGAHLDSRNTMSGSNAVGVAPGADDNGSGSSIVLEIARIIAANPNVRFENDVELMWFCGEEQGLLGSRDIANSYAVSNIDIIGMFNNDMVAYTDPSIGYPVLSFMTGAATSWLSESCKTFVQTYVPDLPSANTGACCSDQQSFFNAGFPAAGIFETPTSRVIYPEYHTPSDTFDNPNVNYKQIFQFGQGNFVCILEYAVPFYEKLPESS